MKNILIIKNIQTKHINHKNKIKRKNGKELKIQNMNINKDCLYYFFDSYRSLRDCSHLKAILVKHTPPFSDTLSPLFLRLQANHD
jgi:hypothetical protein